MRHHGPISQALIATAALLGIAATSIFSHTVSAAEPDVASSIGQAMLGKQLTRIGLDDYRGRRWKTEDFKSDSYLVVAFLGTECPLAKIYAARLQSMQSELEKDGVRIIAVITNRHDSLLDIQSFATRQKLTFPILKDAGGRLADDLDAKRTPEVFVFDPDRKLRYRGRIDDQYGIGYVRDTPRRKDLREALTELAAGKTVSVPKTEAVGCIIGRKKAVDETSPITFGGQVAQILSRHCVECHRDDEIAPFALTDYEEVAGWADMIAEVVSEQRMPPWHATKEHGHFKNERRMTEEEKQILYDWADAGAPAGDLSDLPKLPPKVAGWQTSEKPDRIFKVSPEPFDVPAEGAVKYQYFSVDPGFDHDVWIRSAELSPGNRKVVHHILAFAVPKGRRGGLDAERGFLVGYVPGARVDSWPAGHAKRIPANTRLVFQVHYTPIGVPTQDQSELGIWIADDQQVTHEIVTTSAVQPYLRIPPNESSYQTAATSDPFPANAKLLGMSPHMHVRGKSFRYSLKSSKEIVLDIPVYDFNWQTTYVLEDPLSLDEGDRLVCEAAYDNSEDNLNNPDPSDRVKWGDQTWDEMMIGYFHMAVPRGGATGSGTRAQQRERTVESITRLTVFDRIDIDQDGKVTLAQTPKQFHPEFSKLDENGDGTLTRVEVGSF